MRGRTGMWFEAKIAWTKTMQDGMMKTVMEKYVVEAMSFTEAEARITKELADECPSFEIKDLTIAAYKEVFFSETETDQEEKWYQVKVEYVTIDEKTYKEKKTKVPYLFSGLASETLMGDIYDVFDRGLMEYNIVDLKETKIVDVYEGLRGDD